MKTIVLFLMIPFVLNATQLKVVVKNVQPGKGSVIVDIYTSKWDFLNKSFASKSVLASDTELVFTFDLPAAEYAVSTYQDMNDNKELDFGIFHIPQEPTGFSNDYRPKFGPPVFKDCAIKLTAQPQTIQIELK